MERKVPSATSDEIRLYRSTIYSLLRSTSSIKIRTLEETHAGMNSLLHPNARGYKVDVSAFVYSCLRLPDCFPDVQTVVLAQNSDVFKTHGFPDINDWTPVSARARRRSCRYNGTDTLACYIASRSDIEDIIPALTAYQIEWNKMHTLLQRLPASVSLDNTDQGGSTWLELCKTLEMSSEDLGRLQIMWRSRFAKMIKHIRETELSINIQLLNGSLSQYMRATHDWFENIAQAVPEIRRRPVYFVSSNTHSLVNLLTGFALRQESELIKFIEQSRDSDIQDEWKAIQMQQVRSSVENLLYYVMRKFQGSPEGKSILEAQSHYEAEHGITRVHSRNTFDVETQVIDLSKLDYGLVDKRLANGDLNFLKKSNAFVLNIDYPLGLAAYNILSMLAIHVDILGVYTMGKAASLNAAQGDVIIPNVIQDEHSHNTYLFQNCFSASDVAPYLTYGTVMDNQKAVSVLGTFLQNANIMDVFYREGFADIEMEAGNFCSALYEATRPKRHPTDEIVTLYNSPIDFGVLHYVSDTPLVKGKNLGAGTMSYFGMDSTYASSIAILRRIFRLERMRLV